MSRSIITVSILALVLVATGAPALDGGQPSVEGKVLGLKDVDGFDQLTVLTPRGETVRVRLGQAGTCRGLLLEGDQVRIRLLNGVEGIQANGTALAMRMRVRRTGASYLFRNGAGEMNQQWTRTRARDGSCGRTPGDGCPRDPQCPSAAGGAGGCRGGGGRGQRGGGR